jgi:hypothetical protein
MAVIKEATNAEEDAGEKGPLYTVGGNINQCIHSRNQCGESSKKKKNLKIQQPSDPAISLMGT